MTVYFDDIIFRLQNRGGISSYWEGLTSSLLQRNKLDYVRLDASKRKGFLPVGFERFLPINAQSKGVYHSSYLRIANGSGVKNVVTVHDLMYEKYNRIGRSYIQKLQTAHSLSKADHIICVSEATKRDLEHYYSTAISSPVSVIYNGCSTEFKNENLKRGGFFLYVGSLGYCKNISMVLRLFSMAKKNQPDLKLVMVCPEFDLKEFDDIKHSVIFKGGITNKELGVLYNTAQALLMPSIYEGFGMPALEATRCGCPVLGSLSGSLIELIGGSPLSFQLDNIKSIHSALNNVFDQQKLEEALHVQISNMTGMTWDKAAEEHENIYSDLL